MPPAAAEAGNDDLLDMVVAAGLEDELIQREPRPATREELLAVHTEEHVDLVAGTDGRRHRFDPDLFQSFVRMFEVNQRLLKFQAHPKLILLLWPQHQS